MFKFSPLQELWLQDLESERFKQTSERLADDDGNGHATAFCCMGVACERARTEGLIYQFSFSADYPSNTVCDIFGFIPTHNALIPDAAYATGTRALGILNDSEGRSFPEIAAEVRAQPEKYLIEMPEAALVEQAE